MDENQEDRPPLSHPEILQSRQSAAKNQRTLKIQAQSEISSALLSPTVVDEEQQEGAKYFGIWAKPGVSRLNIFSIFFL